MQRPLLKAFATKKSTSKLGGVKVYAISHVLILAILSCTTIALAAIILDYAGAIDIRFGGDWFQIKIESGEQLRSHFLPAGALASASPSENHILHQQRHRALGL